MLNIRIEKTATPKAKPADESKLGFGKIFSDHMAVIDWNKEEGWHDARIVPFGYLSIHPASTCLPSTQTASPCPAYSSPCPTRLMSAWGQARRIEAAMGWVENCSAMAAYSSS